MMHMEDQHQVNWHNKDSGCDIPPQAKLEIPKRSGEIFPNHSEDGRKWQTCSRSGLKTPSALPEQECHLFLEIYSFKERKGQHYDLAFRNWSISSFPPFVWLWEAASGAGWWKQYAWLERVAAAGSMSGGHQLQPAALWPWLLMATLQAGFARTGLVPAAAVESERSAEQKAIIKVIPLKMDPTGKLNLTLEGVFAGVAEITPAEGKLMQVRIIYYISLPICSNYAFLLLSLKPNTIQELLLFSFLFV